MDDREWMYISLLGPNSITDEWFEKTEAFLELAFCRLKGANRTWCPCRICANGKRQTREVMGHHLCKKGFTKDCTRWVLKLIVLETRS